MTRSPLDLRVRRLEQLFGGHRPETPPLAAVSDRLKPRQREVFDCHKRFRILVAGRRFGKTYLAAAELLRAATQPGSLVWYVGPTLKQARRVAWKTLKQMTQPYWSTRPNETDLRIELATGGTICVRGAENYDGLRGDGLDFLVLDEFATMAPEAWKEVLRPSLADRMGGALFIGTPQGFDHFYDLYQAAKGHSNWATFQFTTVEGENVSPEEIESAAHELDARAFRQEFEASFENLSGGLVYHAFERSKNVEPLRYNPKLPLFWSLDFNVNPMASVIGQRSSDGVFVLEELVLPNSNTWAACEEFLSRIGSYDRLSPFTTRIDVYGDATAQGRHSSTSFTDWQIARAFFRRYPYQVTYHIPSSNPPVKDRVNCVNAVLHNQAGQRRLKIAPGCTQLIADMERVHWKKDLNGNTLAEIDKSDPLRTHVSDALGYMIARDFPMRGPIGLMPGLLQ